MERWWNLPPEDKDDDRVRYDWKPKHEVIPKPGRKEGEPHPDLRASFENTWDNFGLVDEPTPSPRVRLDELLVGFPQQQADRIREFFDERSSRRRRGRPSSDEGRAFRIARKVVRRCQERPRRRRGVVRV